MGVVTANIGKMKHQSPITYEKMGVTLRYSKGERKGLCPRASTIAQHDTLLIFPTTIIGVPTDNLPMSRQRDSNLRPTRYECVALPAELRRLYYTKLY